MKNTISKGDPFVLNGKHLGTVRDVKDISETDGFPTYAVSIDINWVDKGIKLSESNLVNLSFYWEPKEDITPYEIALCLPLLHHNGRGVSHASMYAALSDTAKRHWQCVPC